MANRVFPKPVSPQSANEKYDCCKQGVYDKGLQAHVIELGKIYFVVTDKLEITKRGMMHNYKQCDRNLELPVLISDKHGAADESNKVHLEQSVHLVNKLCHKNSKYYTHYILIKI